MTEDLGPEFELLPAAPRPRRSARLLATAGAVVVLAGGGVATYAALAGSDAGANSPEAAVAKALDDLSHSDLLGVVDDLAPGERDAVRGALTSDIASLKRLGVLGEGADAASVGGVTFAAHDITYGSPVRITDSVQVVPVTGGSIDLSASVAKLPLTSRLLGLLGAARDTSTTQHQKIDPDKPGRVATQRVGGRWYVSLGYTQADDAAHHKVPTAADRIPAKGAASAEDAVRSMITDLTSGRMRDAIALLSPSELGALHDYGGMFVDKAAGLRQRLPFSITDLRLTSTPVDGGTEVHVSRLEATVAGQKLTVAVDGGCLSVTSPLFTKKVCGPDIADLLGGALSAARCSHGFSYGGWGGGAAGSGHGSAPRYVPLSQDSAPYSSKLTIRCAGGGPSFTTAQRTAIAHLFTGLLGAGVITTEVGGEWYVAPVRSLANLTSSALSAMQGDDIFALASLAR